MKDSKIDRIIKSAIKEFSKHGYKKTSINSIVESAGVSKGLLFYHFGTKKDLYIYLVKYLTKVYEKEVTANFDFESTDLLDMVKSTNRFKISLEAQYPYSMDFYLSVINDEVKFDELESFMKESKDLSNYSLYNHILNNIDESVFKEGIDVITALKVSAWVADGYVKDGKFKDMKSVRQNLDEFEELLRKLLYK